MKSKRRYRTLLCTIMKLTFFQLVIMTWLATIACAFPTSAQEMLARKVTISIDKEPIQVVLKELEKAAHVQFVYSSHVVKGKQKISLHIQNENLATVLESIFRKTNIVWDVIGGQIVLKPAIPADDSKGVGVVETERVDFKSFRNITGTVTDASNREGLPGASILLKGETRGTITDEKGNFSLSIPDEGAVLIVSLIGYVSEEIPVKSTDNSINVSLKTDVKALGEVVVVGYGTQSKAKVTGAITRLDAAVFKDVPVSSFDQGMAGLLPGVQVQQASGAPGTSSKITVRSVGTLTAGAQPLLVIDGFPTNNINYSDLNPADVVSVEVLKDASSGAIYGSRASNGVILVTTNKGNSDKPQFSFGMYQGVQAIVKTYKMMNSYQLAQLNTEAWLQNGLIKDVSQVPDLYKPYLANQSGLTSTDWQSELYRNAAIRSYNLNYSGGNKNSRIFLSGEFFDQDGIIVASGYKRYAMRANLETTLMDRADAKVFRNAMVGVNLAPSLSKTKQISQGDHNSDGVIQTNLYNLPFFPAYNTDGSLAIGNELNFFINTQKTIPATNFGQFENSVAVAKLRQNPVERARILSNVYLSTEILEGLTFKTFLGVNYADSRESLFRPSTLGSRRTPAPTIASGSSTTQRIFNYISENTLSYSKVLGGNHTINALAGYSFQSENIQKNSLSGINFPTDDAPTLNAAGQITAGSSTEEEWALISYFGRVNYDFRNRYLLTASIRRDGSSRFGMNKRYGIFPAISAGWRISQEPFFKQLPRQISEFKLRVSYGQTGNDQIPNYGSISILNTSNYVYGNIISNGLAPGNVPNPNLSWEKTGMLDAGLEIGLFRNKLYLTADYYNATTNGLLLNVPMPGNSGYTTSLQNSGRIRRTGIELGLTANEIKWGELSWTGSVNFSTPRSKVLELGPGQQSIITKNHITQVGQPIGQFYGWNIIGVFNTTDEISKTPSVAGTVPGDYIYEDVNKDGKINTDDRKVLGTPYPKFLYGFNSTLKYKGFDLNLILQGSQGNQVFNFVRYFLIRVADFTNGLEERYNGRWISPSEPGTGYARAGATEQYFDRSNRNVENASFLRVRSLTLGYTLPAKVSQKIRSQSLRLYVSSINPLTFTKYSGYNPEVSATLPIIDYGGGALTPGMDWGTYPSTRSFTAGLNLTF